MTDCQREFFQRNRSGCAFAAAAARDMAKFGWRQIICEANPEDIDEAVRQAIADDKVNTISLVFECVKTDQDLKNLIGALEKCDLLYLEEIFTVGGKYGYRFRARVGDLVSWITGFGPFEYFPITRRAPMAELTIRVKARPHYDWNFKDTPDGIVHLADMDMQGMPDKNLWRLWYVSFQRTKKLLGHEPDSESAAKTTFVVPKTIIDQISG